MTKFPILKTSAKSVQTTAEVCADYTCSLYSLRRVLNLGMRKLQNEYAYSLKYLRVLIIVSARTHDNEYVVLIETIMVKHKKWGYAIPAQPHPKNKLYYKISRSFRL